MINSEGIAGIPAINLGQALTAYQPFAVKTTAGGAGPGTPENVQTAGDVWGVVENSGRRGILRIRGAVFTGRVTVPALTTLNPAQALYVAAGATSFGSGAAGAQVAVLLEQYNNTGNNVAVTVNLKCMWV